MAFVRPGQQKNTTIVKASKGFVRPTMTKEVAVPKKAVLSPQKQKENQYNKLTQVKPFDLNTTASKIGLTLPKTFDYKTNNNPVIGENLFQTNVLPIHQKDNIAAKIGKGVVNFGSSLISAPIEAGRKLAIQGGSLLTGHGIQKNLPKNTTFVDNILPPKAGAAVNNFAVKHPVIGGIAKMGIEALADPTNYIGVGAAKAIQNTTKGIDAIGTANKAILAKINKKIPLTVAEEAHVKANPDFFVDPYGNATKDINQAPKLLSAPKEVGGTNQTIFHANPNKELPFRTTPGEARTLNGSKNVLDAQKAEQASNNAWLQNGGLKPQSNTNALPPKISGSTVDRTASSIPPKSGTIRSKLDTLYQKTVNKEQTITNADKQTGITATNAGKSGSTVHHIVHENVVDMAGKPLTNKSLNDTVYVIPKEQRQAYSNYLKQKNAGNTLAADNMLKNNPAVKSQAEFDDYLLNLHNIDRFKNGNPVWDGVTDTMSQQRVNELNAIHPEFAVRAREVTDTINSLEKAWGVNSGLIEDGLHEGLKVKYKNYVPSNNVTTAKSDHFYNSVLSPGKIIKKATGFGDTIVSPTESIPMLINKLVKSSRKQEVYSTLLKAVRENPGAMGEKGIAEMVPANDLEKIHNDKLGQELNQKILNGGIDEVISMSDKALEVDPKGGYFLNVMDKGKPVKLKISEELYKGLDSMGKMDDSELGKFLNNVRKHVTNPFKSLITGYNPIFALKNIFVDTPGAYGLGTVDNPVKFFDNLFTSYKEILTNAPRWQEYKGMGGPGANFFNIEKGVAPTGKFAGVKKKIGAFNNLTENGPRYGEYIGTLKRGESKQQALFNAGEVTTNFGRHGNLTKSIDAGVPYLNPAVQGVDKFIRTLKDRPKQVIAKFLGMVTVPTTVVYTLAQLVDKEGYDGLDNRTKDMYICIPEKLWGGESGKFIKIKKTREAGIIFGSFFERIYRQVQGKPEPWKDFGKNAATNTLPPNPFNTIAEPAIQTAKKNGVDFMGRSIVPTGLQGLSPRYQYDAQSTEVAKALGNLLNISPKKIDYLAKSYGGILASVGQPMMVKSNYSNGKGNIAKSFLGSFTADSLYNNDLQNNFYNNLDKMTTENADAKFKGIDNRSNLSAGMTKATGDMATLRALIKQTESDLNMTPSQKQVKSKDYQQQILDIAKRSNDLFKKGDNSLNAKFPEINGQYYPDNRFTFNKVKVTLDPIRYETYKKLVNDSFAKMYSRIKTIKFATEDLKAKAIDSARTNAETAAKYKIMMQSKLK